METKPKPTSHDTTPPGLFGITITDRMHRVLTWVWWGIVFMLLLGSMMDQLLEARR
jgi:hypothetical protein